MDKDRTAICKIVSEMLDSPDESGIFQTSTAYAELEALVQTARLEGLAWAHTDACVDLDEGRDPRQKVVPEMLNRAETDLGSLASTLGGFWQNACGLGWC